MTSSDLLRLTNIEVKVGTICAMSELVVHGKVMSKLIA